MSRPIPHSLLLVPFSLALFISAAAMFVLQLMVGKMLMPLTGGTPAGWIVALAFFQVALLAGYALAWFLSRYRPRLQGRIYIFALIAGCLALPVALPHQVDGDIGPLLVLKLLALHAGLPAVALAATSSTLQRLFAATGHGRAKDPYFLYAASNLGSVAGLLLYPFVIEKYLGLTGQSQSWFCAYTLLAALAMACLLLAGDRSSEDATPRTPAPSWKQRAEWAMLAFFPSSLMLGVTMDITTDIIAAPLIWIVPMTLYLLTFVIAFSGKFSSGPAPADVPPLAALTALGAAALITTALVLPWIAGWHLMVFTIIALMYHMRLARLRPESDHLSGYYLAIAFGGALGGMLNAFVAPLIFDRLVEYPLVAVLACLVHPALRPLFKRSEAGFYAMALTLAVACWFLMRDRIIDQTVIVVIAVLAISAYAPRALIIPGMVLLFLTGSYVPQVVLKLNPVKVDLRERDFFGIINIHEDKIATNTGLKPIRMFMHGSTMHGYQFLSPGDETTLTAYYRANGPIGDIFRAFEPRKVGDIGLGAGILACYNAPDRQFTFFEIDPAVVGIAKSQFSFLDRCKGETEPHIYVGDGRLEMAKLTEEKFDLILVDAFSSDMVPAHLLTREAIQMYLRHLEPGGVIVFHVTNRYLHLDALMAAAAAKMGLAYRWKGDDGGTDYSSAMGVIATEEATLDKLDASKGWEKVAPREDLRPWTDDYSSIIDIIER